MNKEDHFIDTDKLGDDIHSAYELLVEFISMLVFIKKQLINEKTK